MEVKGEHKEHLEQNQLGGKAQKLVELKSLGYRVPDFLVINSADLDGFIPEELETADIAYYIDKFSFPEGFLSSVNDFLNAKEYVAVRSSALVEDGNKASFAGQFVSELYVNTSTLTEAIKKVWKSAFSENIIKYKAQLGVSEREGISIIIQEMIESEKSGVGFGLNPITSDPDQKLINANFGLGESVVGGTFDTDTYLQKEDGSVEITVAEKSHETVWDSTKKSGTINIELSPKKGSEQVLNNDELTEVFRLLDELYQHFGHPQDIEFAFAKGQLYLLQSRPITTTIKLSNHIIWDNSNIIESYPGVTTPLTFSFISDSYKVAYSLFSGYLGVKQEVINRYEYVFQNTLGLINGRVYYNLKTWYQMLAMVPGYSINARYMETMMGVKERFDIPDDFKLSKTQAWLSVLKMALKMIQRMWQLPVKRRAFKRLLDETISQYVNLDYDNLSAEELLGHYRTFESKLLNEWKAPLLNDFFAMIWFGMLKSQAEKMIKSSNANIHNDLLCGSRDIISVEPVHRSIEIATFIQNNKGLKNDFERLEPEDLWEQVDMAEDALYHELKQKILDYLDEFGERCVGELKLETASYTQEPEKFVKVIKSYVQNNISQATIDNSVELELRRKAEAEVKAKLKFKPLNKWWFNIVLNQARSLVSNRENLRFERTRAFGIVRRIFNSIGDRFYENELITHPKDIFYLTKNEIAELIEGRSVTQSVGKLISLRKSQFMAFQEDDVPAERFESRGVVYARHNSFFKSLLEEVEGDLTGIGCSPGRVKGKVKYVKSPDELSSVGGDILITSSTDPGWVTLFPTASAIIVERGSLLSHSAIVSREMGIPCIVGVTGLLRSLNTGDEIQMDGSTGLIKVINKVG